MTPRVAVYAGMFDPLTVGHLWVIEEGLKLFDTLIVAVGVNPTKTPLFSVEERCALLREACAPYERITIDHFENEFLIDYAKRNGAEHILRSIRTESDYEYERMLNHVNKDIDPSITTVFVMPPREISEVSSSMVKQLVGIPGWEQAVQKYVPLPVLKKLQEKHAT